MPALKAIFRQLNLSEDPFNNPQTYSLNVENEPHHLVITQKYVLIRNSLGSKYHLPLILLMNAAKYLCRIFIYIGSDVCSRYQQGSLVSGKLFII